MDSNQRREHWLDRYGNRAAFEWQILDRGGRDLYHRPLGVVETLFDCDGRYWEGRADMNVQLELGVRNRLSHEDFRERILFSWAVLRCQHLLLQARAVSGAHLSGPNGKAECGIHFAIHMPRTVIQAIEDAGDHLVFLKDHFDHVDPIDFYRHCQNTARVVDPERAMARLYVHDLEPTSNGKSTLRFLTVGGHQIQEGLTCYTWASNLVGFLNQSVPELRTRLRQLLEPISLYERLPLPQEALYPHVTGSLARRRWFWLLTRILRHVRKPLQAGFANPLQRRQHRQHASPMPEPMYFPLLDYTRLPPLNSVSMFAKISGSGTQKLHRICRDVHASIGAGCFALVALLMMEMYERREPDVPLADRRPFISGFPLNPRALFNHHVKPDSLMLCFCDGIWLPFLPASLDLEGRLRLLTRQAHRQLAAYQKRPNPRADKAGIQDMGSRGTGRLLAVNYIAGVETTEIRLPVDHRRGLNPQGAYPMRPNMTMQTCGVSSVGRRQNVIQRDLFDLDDESTDFAADYRNILSTVRPRDDEFLVGIGGDYDGIWLNASLDDNAIDPTLAEEWRRRFETGLDEVGDGRSSRL